MNRAIPLSALVVIVIGTLANTRSQEEAKVNDPPDPSDPLLTFSVKDYRDVDLVRRARDKAIRQCKQILKARAKQQSANPPNVLDGYSATAVSLLGELRAKDSECIDALCDDLTSKGGVIAVSGDAFVPLRDFPAAKALVQIGGREATEGILRRMKNKLERRELLICAHVLSQIDDRAVILERMRVSLTTRRRGEDPLKISKNFLSNLDKVREWLEDPSFATGEEFRP